VVERKELDAVVERIERLAGVTHATWESSTGN
jgi:putative Mg2+ transporter-C (MgtC) family protein